MRTNNSGRVSAQFEAVVLAGERAGESGLGREFGVAAGALVPLAGRASIARVVDAVRASYWVEGGILCGPDRTVVDGSDILRQLLEAGDFRWMQPDTGPAASAVAALAQLNRPTLVTTGDHPLLSAETLDEFCRRACASPYDAVVGLVPFELVRKAYPESHRTVFKFSDDGYCGCNLFAILTPEGRCAPGFWQQVEADRKRPWRIARRLGRRVLLRYLARRLSLDEALQVLSERAGCRIGYVLLGDCTAAIDVDSVADWHLAQHLLETQAHIQQRYTGNHGIDCSVQA